MRLMKKPIPSTRRKEIAALAKINEQYLYQCLAGLRDMSATLAVQLELVTNKEITRFMVCQKSGHLIWPELSQPSTPEKEVSNA